MVMRMTSIEAHEEITESGKASTQMALIYLHLEEHGSKTRRQLAKELDIETSTISARVNALKKLGKVKDEQKVECPISKKTVYLVECL